MGPCLSCATMVVSKFFLLRLSRFSGGEIAVLSRTTMTMREMSLVSNCFMFINSFFSLLLVVKWQTLKNATYKGQYIPTMGYWFERNNTTGF